MNINLSYKKRLERYRRWKKGESFVLKDVAYERLIKSVESDYTLTINDTADILGFSVEHVQNNVLQHLDVVDAREYADGGEYDLRTMLCNHRLKRIVSKKSLEEYIASNLSVCERRTVTTFSRESDEIEQIKKALGKGAKIQRMLDDAGKYLDERYDYKKLEIEEIKRKEKIKKMYIENNVDMQKYLENKDDSIVDILDYSSTNANGIVNDDDAEMFDILVNDMYSVKGLKKLWGMRHTMQVYRELDRTSYVAVKLGSADYDTSFQERSTKGDRNIRYIINAEDLKIQKNVYRISLNHAVYNKIQLMAETLAIEVEDALMIEILEFAKANKEKYKKKKKEEVE